jgi:hypothetical protein
MVSEQDEFFSGIPEKRMNKYKEVNRDFYRILSDLTLRIENYFEKERKEELELRFSNSEHHIKDDIKNHINILLEKRDILIKDANRDVKTNIEGVIDRLDILEKISSDLLHKFDLVNKDIIQLKIDLNKDLENFKKNIDNFVKNLSDSNDKLQRIDEEIKPVIGFKKWIFRVVLGALGTGLTAYLLGRFEGQYGHLI